MDDMRVWIGNLGKYNEGELVGGWFNLPVEEEDFAEEIGLNDRYEEWAIFDTENLPFDVDEYESLDELNRKYYMAEELLEQFGDDLYTIMRETGFDIDQIYDGKDDIYYHAGCDDMSDVAYEIIHECGYLDGANEIITRYIDYEAFGRDLDLEGTYIICSGGIYEIVW